MTVSTKAPKLKRASFAGGFGASFSIINTSLTDTKEKRVPKWLAVLYIFTHLVVAIYFLIQIRTATCDTSPGHWSSQVRPDTAVSCAACWLWCMRARARTGLCPVLWVLE